MISFVPNTIQINESNGATGDQQRHLHNTQQLTQSLNFSTRSTQSEKERNFLNTIQIVPGASYQIYKPTGGVPPITEHNETNRVDGVDDSLLRSIELSGNTYGHNISNPDLWRSRFRDKSQTPVYDSGRFGGSLKVPSERNQRYYNRRISGDARQEIPQNLPEKERRCQCKQYHCHTFSDADIKQALFRLTSTSETSSLKSHEVQAYNGNHLNIANACWRPSLSMQAYKHGDPLVTFTSLWPRDITSLLRDGMNNTALRDAISDLCRLSLVCGPVQLLRSLIELCLIRKCS